MTHAVLKRQITCLRKRNAALTKRVREVQAAERLIRWAKRFANSEGGWNEMQLKRAARQMMPNAKLTDAAPAASSATGVTD